MPTAPERSDELAEIIERRRRELGLTIGAFASTAGLTRQGLDPIRRGVLKSYEDRTIFGIARALRWAPDWYDRILHGGEPTPADEGRTDNGVDDVVDVTGLSAADKEAVRLIVERFRTR